jgi:tRNA-dihydrouridine synthase 1
MASEMRSDMSTTATASLLPTGTLNGAGANGVEGGGKRRKLHGRAFYESIGSPKLVLAPMVEQSEFVRLRPPAHRTES